MSTTLAKNNSPHWLPNVVGLKSLFVAGTDGTKTKAYGFPDGSCILLAGAPGTGKTVVALTMVRSLLNQRMDAAMYLISTELNREKLTKDFAEFGWFASHDKLFGNVQIPELPELGWHHYPDGAGGLVKLVLDRTREHAAEHLEQDKKRPLFVIVDSLTALLKDSQNRGDRRRQAYQCILKLAKSVFPYPPSLLFLISELSVKAEEASIEVAPEEYIADFVFKLALKPRAAGSRLRTFEVVKSRGARMLLGEHTFSIVTPEHLSDVIAQPLLADHVAKIASEASEKSGQWGSIVISPRPKLAPIGRSNEASLTPVHAAAQAPRRLTTGTSGLDAMLEGAFDYWAMRNVPQQHALYEGSTTLLLGTAGTGKTILSLQFLLAHDDPSETMYVNFQDMRARVLQMYPSGHEESLKRLANCQFLYRRRANLDINILFSELCHVIDEKKVKRVVIDGLSDLLSTTNQKEYSWLVETLIASILKVSGGNATTFVTYEMPPNFSGFAPPTEGLSVTADNIVVLRHVPINDELRKTVYILKSRGHRPDRGVREIRIVYSMGPSPPLRIQAGLESYRNLLLGEPEPLKVSLHLFAENLSEQRFNTKMIEALATRFGYKVTPSVFSRPEITRTLEDAVSPISRVPPSDVKVLSLDEWWIREYAVDVRLAESVHGEGSQPHPLMSLDQFSIRTGPRGLYNTTSDHWLFEMEKASIACTLPDSTEADSVVDAYTLGVPNYMDFGLFCVNDHVWQECELGQDSGGRQIMRFKGVPRVWAMWNGREFAPPDPSLPQPTTIIDLLEAAKQHYEGNHGSQGFVGFAFDMETVETLVCSYFEFCWSFGAPEDFLIRGALDYASRSGEKAKKQYVKNCPAAVALRFLQHLVSRRLMPFRTTLDDCKSALFSRQWYSTLCDLAERSNDKVDPPSALPFFPVGLIDRSGDMAKAKRRAISYALEDARIRFERLVGRCVATVEYRFPDKEAKLLGELRGMREAWRNALRPREYLHDNKKIQDLIDKLRDAGKLLGNLISESECFIPGSHVSVCAGHRAKRGQHPFIPAARWMDKRDVHELLRWHDFRLDLIEGQLKQQNLIDKAYGLKHPGEKVDGVSALTGYACSGSWMLGVLRPARSPMISWMLIEEITSRQSAFDRSMSGAGMPSRKDFFEFHGNEPVRHIQHLTWNDLLRFAGSRARRRDRTVCTAIRVSGVSECIYSQVMRSLAAADISDDSSALFETATDAIRTIIEYVVDEMRHAWGQREEHGHCVLCKHYKDCKSAFEDR